MKKQIDCLLVAGSGKFNSFLLSDTFRCVCAGTVQVSLSTLAA